MLCDGKAVPTLLAIDYLCGCTVKSVKPERMMLGTCSYLIEWQGVANVFSTLNTFYYCNDGSRT